MKKKSAKIVISKIFIGALLIPSLLVAQNRPMPGANFGDNSVPPTSTGDDSNQLPGANPQNSAEANTALRNVKVGDYVELDAAIRNELYGTIDFPNAELKDIVRAISKLAGKNFILDRKLENRRITIISPQAVTKQEAYNAFLSALFMNDLTIVSLGKFLKIIETKSALQSNIRVFAGDYAPPSEEIVTLLYPLRYLNAEEIQRFLVDLVPRNGRITAYPNTNTLVMTDTGLNLRRIIAVLKSIDVQGHEDRLESIPVRHASAKGIAQLIDDILDAQGGSGARRGGANRGPQKTRGGGIISKIVPDERTNSLVVLANGRGVKELKDLVAKLDTPGSGGSGNIHIYYLKNAIAEELAATINSLISGQKPQQPGAAPIGFTPPTIPGANTNRRSGSGSVEEIKLEGNIKVTADKATNALVVVGSSSDFAALKTVLEKLDIPRRQVYVEATIMEIKTGGNDTFSFGVNVAAPGVAQVGGFNPSPKVKFIDAVSTPASLAGLVAGFTAGQSYDFEMGGKTFKLSTVTGLIQMIQETNQGQILHQPQILTSDNEDSEINVTDKIPVPNTTTSLNTTSGTPTTQRSFTKEDVVISLKIKPQIGEDNELIKLKVDQAIDDFTPTGDEGQIEITKRKANTLVSVRSGDTVAVGGLQKTRSSDTRSKFPLLGDLPIIGFLFKGSESNVTKSNLILFLTPHIIRSYDDLLNITSKKLEARKAFGKKLYDPKDVQQKDLDDLIKKNKEDRARVSKRGVVPPAVEADALSTQGVIENKEVESPLPEAKKTISEEKIPSPEVIEDIPPPKSAAAPPVGDTPPALKSNTSPGSPPTNGSPGDAPLSPDTEVPANDDSVQLDLEG